MALTSSTPHAASLESAKNVSKVEYGFFLSTGSLMTVLRVIFVDRGGGGHNRIATLKRSAFIWL
jgi:hypothetical protein